MITSLLTIVTDNIVSDISRIIDTIRHKNYKGLNIRLIVDEPMIVNFERNQVYIRECTLSTSFMQCFSEVYVYSQLVYRRETNES